MAEISVIIPVYNSAKYLECCLNSIDGQTFKDFEVIIIDDGSTDDSGKIAQAFAEKNKKFTVTHTKNAGVSSARNLGLSLAKGKYVTFVDSDDLLPQNALQILYNAVKKSGAEIAVGKLDYYQDGTETRLTVTDEITLLDNAATLNACLEDRPISFSSCGKLYERQFLDGLKFEVGRRINEDAFFVFECFEKCSLAAVTESTCYLYRLNESSSSRAQFSEKYFDILYFLDKKLTIISTRHPALTDKAYNMRVKANMALLDKLCRARDKKYKQAEKACRKEIKKYRKYYISSSKRDDVRLFFMLRLYPLYKLIQSFR